MVDVQLREIQPISWDDAMVIIAFPTTGSVASIAGHYLRQNLKLPLVGSFSLDPGPGVVAVRAGIATSPVRIFGGEVECKLPEGECPYLFLILADIPLPPAALRGLSPAILAAAKSARIVLCLDGVVRDEDDDKPDVFAVASDPSVLPSLDQENVEPLGDAFIGGMTGQLLLDAPASGARVGALIVEAARNMPDGRAAAALIDAIDHLLPLVPVESEPLVQEAMQLEEEIRRARESAEQQQILHKPDMDTFI